MIVGIVGNSANKFTVLGAARAKEEIRRFLQETKPRLVVSGACPMGGVDIWAIEIAKKLGIKTREFAPEVNQWNPPGKYGFMARNLDIAKADVVLCVLAEDFPPGYKGPNYGDCYHCKGRNPKHVKSGGCWTALRCKKQVWKIVSNV